MCKILHIPFYEIVSMNYDTSASAQYMIRQLKFFSRMIVEIGALWPRASSG